ncbi:phosphatidylinositol polyphosphate 5-phosphatase type IV isoform X3 [Narcine bancroftii]|uniref:phosphatidylinositol polyphosphate 5-phosphatase type IV isoform X3 n=1 Tax=Narcine bancroftii TaxID=1343680 RepID=UPI003831CA67
MGDEIELPVHSTSYSITNADSRAWLESTPFLSDTVKYPPEELGHGVQGMEARFTPRPPVKPKPPRQSKLQRLHSLENTQINQKAKFTNSEESSSEPIDTDSSCGSISGDLSGSSLPCLQGRSTVASQKLLSRSGSSSSSMRDCNNSQSANSMAEYRNSITHLDSESNSKTVPLGRKRLPPVVHTKPLPPISINMESPALRTSNRIDVDYADYIHVTSELSNQHNNILTQTQGTKENQSSFSMTSSSRILLPVSSEDLRNRSYLEGSLLANRALLGASELNRFFPDGRIRVFIATWNMQGQKDLPETLDDLLLPCDSHLIHDLYAIGIQEGTPDNREWEIRLQEILGPNYVLLSSAVHGVLQLSMFIKRDLIWFCSEVEQASVTTRIISQIKTKGAVGISFTFFGTSFLFISSHFTSGPGKIYERMLDYDKTIKALELPKIIPDTNIYRSDPRTIFKGFKEAEISFPPTYKFDTGCDVYDSSAKKRTPSYTDRIIHKSRQKGDILVVKYGSCASIKTSDHRPVYCFYQIKIRPGRDNIPLCAGQFGRDIYLEGIKRRFLRQQKQHILLDQKSSTVCSVS